MEGLKTKRKGKNMGEVDMCLNEKVKQDSSSGHYIGLNDAEIK